MFPNESYHIYHLFLFLHPHNRPICSMVHLHLTKAFVIGNYLGLICMDFVPAGLFIVETVLNFEFICYVILLAKQW
jgi:hypothetical protein